jgi:dTDP-4-dehydrorhamnose 3,5-epimerase
MPFTFEDFPLSGLKLITPKIFTDARGFFCESYKQSEFRQNGIDVQFKQDDYSCSAMGVLRGLHYQISPYTQGKLIMIVKGRIWDVAVDIRKDSPTFGRWEGMELSEDNHRLLWIPPGFAHGFVSLSDSVHFLYKCTEEYCKQSERGIKWNDPDLSIEWPLQEISVSERDAALPSLREADLL